MFNFGVWFLLWTMPLFFQKDLKWWHPSQSQHNSLGVSWRLFWWIRCKIFLRSFHNNDQSLVVILNVQSLWTAESNGKNSSNITQSKMYQSSRRGGGILYMELFWMPFNSKLFAFPLKRFTTIQNMLALKLDKVYSPSRYGWMKLFLLNWRNWKGLAKGQPNFERKT